ncbi:MAG: hypothetical protein CMK71_01745 [Pseudomonadaceae bacterium]|nr:hypothetical protein [Pseudomonadaceae bacterium]
MGIHLGQLVLLIREKRRLGDARKTQPNLHRQTDELHSTALQNLKALISHHVRAQKPAGPVQS